MQPNRNLNTAKQGMNRDTASEFLSEQEYCFSLNTNDETSDGNTYKRNSEPSNLLTVVFPEGYKNVGYKNNILDNKTYFFITNPQTGFSKFGYVQNNNDFDLEKDTLANCKDCDFKNILQEPLENQNQNPFLNFVELLDDSCNKGFNLNINFPIRKIEIKNEKGSSILYFTDYYNPPRYIDLRNIDKYKVTGSNLCGVDNTTSICLDADKLRMFPIRNNPIQKPVEIVVGGNLKLGTYEFLIAYCDNLGNEQTQYESINIPVSIFDENNTILEQSEIADRTNFAIRLEISNLDTNFSYYKIAVIQTTDIQQAVSYFIEGVHPITDTTVLYTTEENKQRTTIDQLFYVFPNVNKAEGLTAANKTLFLYGIEAEKEWNLQPVVNLLGGFLRWQTHVTTEDFYKNGINAYLRGYSRDEQQPFSIRFGSNTGYVTALFPLINRPATTVELQDAPINNDTNSIQSNVQNCSSSVRTKRWHYYNDAVVLGQCDVGQIQTNTITDVVQKTCIIEQVVTTPSGFFSVERIEDFTTLEDFINDNTKECFSYPFCEYIDPDLYPDCTPSYENCDTPILQDQYLLISDNGISGEVIEEIEVIFPNDYKKTAPNRYCNLYVAKPDGGFERDSDAEALINVGSIYLREYTFTNDSCAYADDIFFRTSVNNTSFISYFHNYLIGDNTLASIQTTYDSTCTNSLFSNKVHKNALWFNIPLLERDRFIFEITKQINPRGDDGISRDANQFVRVTFFDNCGTTTPLYCEIVDMTDGTTVMLDKTNGLLIEAGNFFIGQRYIIEQVGTTDFTLIGATNNNIGTVFTATGAGSGTGLAREEQGTQLIFEDNFNNKTIYDITGSNIVLAIDCLYDQDALSGRYFLRPTNGCFGVLTRPVEIGRLDISYDSITFDKVQVYKSDCDFEVPIVNNCELLPYEYGKFGYFQSEENYPDNNELYNSSNLVINQADIPVQYQTEFEQYYVDAIDTGQYNLKSSTNFSCTPIRHYRFPDNKVSPFMWDNPQAPFTSSIIFPLGITIDDNLINSFLDIAVNNSLITQSQRDSITYYEIFRGDTTLDKSIIAKGLLYDMYKYEEDDKQIEFSNFPFNDLGKNRLLYTDENRNNFIDHPYNSDSNISWTFHCPEPDYTRPSLGTEMKVEGFMFGASKGIFAEVENHPKWTILGREAYRLASTLTTAEVIAEAAIAVAESSEVYRFDAGVVVSANPVGIAFNIAVAATQVLSSVLYKYGRYKYQWLETFRNLGQPTNFAYYYTSVGEYNFFQPLQTESQQLRSLNVSRYLKEGKFELTDEAQGTRIQINNIDREKNVYLKIDDSFPLTYPIDYKSYDNSDQDRNTASRFLLSEAALCKKGDSSEIIRNIASPYVSLKTFKPSQYGTIDSVRWLTTGYRGDLTNPSSDCKPIYGGTVFISRHTLKRKVPLFLRDAMNVPSLTPFNYKFYSNLGREPRYFCNYEVSDDINLDRGFPELKSEYNFDCLTGDREFYVKEPSKFYLYYYGIPSFLCETEINTNYRYGKKEPENNFYPNIQNYVDYTQEKTVSIRRPNTFFYNFAYSKNVTSNIFRTLPYFYNKEDFDTRYDMPNGGLYSLIDNSENDLIDPWLVFRPLDKFELSTENGKLVDLVKLQNEQLLARFTNGIELYNSFTELVDDGKNPEKTNLGNGGIFNRRVINFTQTSLGDKGTQSTEYCLTPYGLFYTDAKRGKVYNLKGNDSPEEISTYSNGQLNGMRNWFRENLPFKILKHFSDLNIDNKFKSIGISMGFDNRYDRVFITKKDYIPKPNLPGTFSVTKGVLFYNDIEVDFTNNALFEDVSFTISYSPLKGVWGSYYSFIPDYYIEQQNFFQTGINYSPTTSKIGLWSHLLTNKSFCVFYGQKYPLILEVPYKKTPNKVLQSISFSTEARRYQDTYNYSVNRYLTYNKAIVYNDLCNSGLLNLVPRTKDLRDISKYPITRNGSQDVLITSVNEIWNLNYFFNRVKNDLNNIPVWVKDSNDIYKQINNNTVSFHGKSVLERIKGENLKVRFIYDKDSRYNISYNFSLTKEQLI